MTDEVVAVPPRGRADERMNLGAISWSVFEGARNPYVILVTIYIFMPYVAASVVGGTSPSRRGAGPPGSFRLRTGHGSRLVGPGRSGVSGFAGRRQIELPVGFSEIAATPALLAELGRLILPPGR